MATIVRRTAWYGDWSYGRGHVAARPMPTSMIPLGDVLDRPRGLPGYPMLDTCH